MCNSIVRKNEVALPVPRMSIGHGIKTNGWLETISNSRELTQKKRKMILMKILGVNLLVMTNLQAAGQNLVCTRRLLYWL